MAAELLAERNPAELMVQVDRNRRGFLGRLGRSNPPDLPYGIQAEVYRTQVPHALLNGVASIEAPNGGLEEGVGALVRWGNRGHVPWCVWVPDRYESSGLASLLLSYGMDRHLRLAGLATYLPEGGPPATSLPGFLVQRVETEADLHLYLLALGRSGFLGSASEVEGLARCITSRDLRSDRSLRLLLGLSDGRPVAVATIFVEGTTAGVYGLAVDASVRGNHFGAALLTACLRQSASWGCQAVVATAPRDETGTYRRLGFEEYEEIDCFALDPAQLGPLERDAV